MPERRRSEEDENEDFDLRPHRAKLDQARIRALVKRLLPHLVTLDATKSHMVVEDTIMALNGFRLIFEKVPFGVLLLNESMSPLFWNQKAVELLDLDPDKAEGALSLAVHAPDPDIRRIFTRVMLSQDAHTDESVEIAIRPEKLVVQVTVQKTLWKEGQEDKVRFLVTIANVTKDHEAKEKARRNWQTSTMATLSTGLAHEIKNPLNSLLIHAQLLQSAILEMPISRRKSSGVDRERMLHSSSVIVDEIMRLNAKLNEFLIAVRPQRSQRQPNSVAMVVLRVADTLRPEIEAAGVELRVAVDHDLPLVTMDPQQITQVLHNLIKNSLEALKEGVGSGISGSQTQDQFLIDSETIVDGQKRPMIEIRTKPSSVGVAVSVHDNGPGIPKELFPRILEPYFTSKDHGTGLGLNIVSRIVEDHGGQLIVATRPVVEGTTMTVFLPTAEGYSRSLEGASMGQEDRNGDEGKFLL